MYDIKYAYVKFLSALYESLDYFCAYYNDEDEFCEYWQFIEFNDNGYFSYDYFKNPEHAYDKDGAPMIERYKDIYTREHGCVALELSAKPLGCSAEIVYEFNGKI